MKLEDIGGTEPPAEWRVGSNPAEQTMKRFIVELQVDTADDKTWDDVEWAVRELFVDDEHGNPNFTVGAVCLIKAEEVSEPIKIPCVVDEVRDRIKAGQMRQELLAWQKTEAAKRGERRLSEVDLDKLIEMVRRS
jgi:hypothetical protein